MLRVALVVMSLSVVVGGALLQHSMHPKPSSLVSSASQGLRLTRIVVPDEAPITTAAEADEALRWWALQESPLIVMANHLLASTATVEPDGWRDIFALRGEDDSLLVLFTGSQGLVGRCWFAADGSLRACDQEADETQPLIVKHPGGNTLPLTDAHARMLGIYLLRLRNADGYQIIDQALVEPGDASWERDAKGWKRSARMEISDHAGTGTTILLDANGALLQAGLYHWAAGCCSQPKSGARKRLEVADDPEPSLPVANN
jgi:hypothetical protein